MTTHRNALAALALAGAMLAAPAAAQQYLTFGSSGSGGTYGIIGAAMSKVVNSGQKDIHMTVEATPGGGRGNVRLLGQGKLDFGLATVPDAVQAWEGGEGYDAKLDNLRTLLVGTSLPFHLVVLANSDIKSIEDVRGKRVITNSSANALTFVPDALAAAGLAKTDYELVQQATTEAMEAMKDGRADVFATFFFMPAAPLVDLATSKGIRLLPMQGAPLEKLLSSHKIYAPEEIPAGTYPGMDAALTTASINVAVFTHDKVSEATAYAVTKLLLAHRDELAEIYKPASYFSGERQSQQLGRGQPVPPYHAGAERAFREAGLLK